MKKTGKSYLSGENVLTIDANFQDSISSAIGLNFRNSQTLPKWVEKPMSLLEVSAELNVIIEMPEYKVM